MSSGSMAFLVSMPLKMCSHAVLMYIDISMTCTVHYQETVQAAYIPCALKLLTLALSRWQCDVTLIQLLPQSLFFPLLDEDCTTEETVHAWELGMCLHSK